MRKLPITKETFEKSRYFTDKYGTLKYVSESGRLFKTNKGRILKFKESKETDEFADWYFKPSDELIDLYRKLKSKYERGGVEVRISDMMNGVTWLTVEIPEDDERTIAKMEKILSSNCQGKDWEFSKDEHMYGNVTDVRI